MNEAERQYSDLLHLQQDAACGRAMRKLVHDAADLIRRPGADRLLICWQTLERFRQLIDDDAEYQLGRASSAAAALNEQLSQSQLDHLAKGAQNSADRATNVITLIMAVLAEGQKGRWPSLFPPQEHAPGAPVDSNYAVMRGYFAAELEYARQLALFENLTEIAELLAKEANRLGGAAGHAIKGEQIMDWRQQVRSVAKPDDSIDKATYQSVLEALLSQPEQPETREQATVILRGLVGACSAIDPRRAGEKH
jgi:hypothetical protein